MAHCTQCGAPLKANKAFCTACGAKAKLATAAPQTMPQAPTSTPLLCSKCGATVPRGKQFCAQCGQSILAAAPSQAGASTTTTSQPPVVAEVECRKCGATVPRGKRFCTACGNPVEAKPADALLPPQYPPNPPVIEAAPLQTPPVEIKPLVSKMTPARRRLLYIGLPVAAVILVAAALFTIYALFIRKPPHLDDKQLLESYYGAPPFFTVILASDESQPSAKPVRREVWVYPDRKVSFVFLGGKYQFSSDLQSLGKGAAKAAKKLRLEQITEQMTVDDLSKLVGNKPVTEANLPKEELPDAIRYDYGNGINAVFSQGRLLMVRILPAGEEK
ncbi:MAG: zinc ribbon domain-containing protein [Blastocatellia bacterium]